VSIPIVMIFVGILLGAYQFFGIDTYGVTLVDIGMIAFLVATLKRLLWDGAEIVVKRSLPMLLLLAMLGFVFISGLSPLTSGDTAMQIQYLKTSTHYLYIWLITFISAIYPFENIAWKRGVQSWVILSVPINIFGVYQIVARAFDLPFAWINMNNIALATRGRDMADMGQLSLSYESFYRATSIFSEPSALAGFNAFVLTAIFVTYIKKTPSFISSDVLRKVIVVCSLVGIFLTFSLTGLALMLAVMAFAVLTERTANVLKLVKIIAVSSVIIIITNIAVESYSSISVSALFTQRVGGIVSSYTGGSIETTTGESFFYRASNMAAAIKTWMHRPFTGIGLGCMYNFTKDKEYGFTDSTFFQSLADTGFGGLLCISGLCVSTILLLYRITKNKQYQMQTADAKMLIVFSLYMAVQNVITMFTTTLLVSVPLWLIWGMMLSLIHSFSQTYPAYRFRLVAIPLKEILAKQAVEVHH